MTSRERVLCAIHHTKPDRIPIAESFWEDTLTRWRNEGLPENITPSEYFDFDIIEMGIDASPRFKAYLIDENEEFMTLQDRFGYVAKKHKGISRTLDYLSYPAPDRASWEKVKPMFVVKDDERSRIDTVAFPFRLEPEPTWQVAREKFRALREKGKYILASMYGPHEAVWRLHGFTETLMDLVIDPGLITDIAATYVDFLIQVIGKCLEEGICFDGFFCVEDIASTRGMLFSPGHWRSIYKPPLKKLGDFLHENGIGFWMHSCGNGEAVFEDLIECGVKVINPLEAKSGLDIRVLKDKYGGRLAFYGNIDVIAMAKSESAIEQEIRGKLASFRNIGGYIFHSDHSIPPEISFERYSYIMKLARQHGKCK